MTTREKIINTVIEKVMDEPMENLGVRDIAAKAGVNIAAVNYHFGSKEQLLTEAINTIVVKNLDAWITENLDNQRAGHTGLAKFMVELHYNTIAYRVFSKTKLQHLLSSGLPDEANKKIFQTIGNLLKTLGVPAAKMPLYASVLFNSLMSFSVDPDTAAANAGIGTTRKDLEKYIEKLLSLLLNNKL